MTSSVKIRENLSWKGSVQRQFSSCRLWHCHFSIFLETLSARCLPPIDLLLKITEKIHLSIQRKQPKWNWNRNNPSWNKTKEILERLKKELRRALVNAISSPNPTPPSSKLFNVLLGGSLGKLKAFHCKSHYLERHIDPTKALQPPTAASASSQPSASCSCSPQLDPKVLEKSYQVTLKGVRSYVEAVWRIHTNRENA